MTNTQIQISTQTRKELKSIRLFSKETYEEIMKRLIASYKEMKK